MKICSLAVGNLGTNCYILCREEEGVCIIADPGDEAERIEQEIDRLKLKPECILLTHGHFDHISAVNELQEYYKQLPVWASAKEEDLLADPEKNLSEMFVWECSVNVDFHSDSAQDICIAGFEFRAIPTPGHTRGSMCYYCEEGKFMLTGDTIFAESVGRTDFPTGSSRELRESVKKVLDTVPKETVILPGHGPKTTVEHERIFNPYYG